LERLALTPLHEDVEASYDESAERIRRPNYQMDLRLAAKNQGKALRSGDHPRVSTGVQVVRCRFSLVHLCSRLGPFPTVVKLSRAIVEVRGLSLSKGRQERAASRIGLCT
jgi:hypothetical protein